MCVGLCERESLNAAIKQSSARSLSNNLYEEKHDNHVNCFAISLILINLILNISLLPRYVDYIGLMSYDFNGAWDSVTGLNAPLYSARGVSQQQAQRTVVSLLL